MAFNATRPQSLYNQVLGPESVQKEGHCGTDDHVDVEHSLPVRILADIRHLNLDLTSLHLGQELVLDTTVDTTSPLAQEVLHTGS